MLSVASQTCLHHGLHAVERVLHLWNPSVGISKKKNQKQKTRQGTRVAATNTAEYVVSVICCR